MIAACSCTGVAVAAAVIAATLGATLCAIVLAAFAAFKRADRDAKIE